MDGGMDGGNRRRPRADSKITQLPVNIQDQVDAMIRDSSNTYADISDWLKSQGYTVSKSAVGRYAMHVNKAAQRVIETLERTKAIADAVENNPDMDYTKASRIIMMEGLIRRVSTAEDDFLQMPLDKAGRLIDALSRTEAYEQKVRYDMRKKAELAFDQLEAELMSAIKQDPALSGELHSILMRAREKVLTDGEN